MGQDYTITKVEERDTWLYQGQPMQDYAIALQGEDGWIKLTQKPDTKPPVVNGVIHGIIENKKNPNGTAYRKFKKVNPNFGGNRTGGAAPVSDSRLDYVVQMLEELTGRRPAPDVVHEVKDDPLDDPFKDI
jgi:hypothetical protein